jgi:hypothetical protein
MLRCGRSLDDLSSACNSEKEEASIETREKSKIRKRKIRRRDKINNKNNK